MSPERRQRLDAHLDAVLDLPTLDQDGYVERLSTTDASLGAELRELLKAHRLSHGWLDAPAASLRAATDDAARPSTVQRPAGITARPHLGTRPIADLGTALDAQVVARAMRTYLWVWPAFGVLDAYLAFVAYPGASFTLCVVCRLVVEGIIVALYRAVLRESVDIDRLLTYYNVACGLAAFAVVVMAVQFGGIQSPYIHGVTMVSLVCALLLPIPWRRALPSFIAMAFMPPVVFAGAAWMMPDTRAAWLAGAGLKLFVGHYSLMLAGSALGLVVSNLVWTTQQQARQLGSYELEALIGRGGMGDVWRARHRLLARPAAVKVIRPEVLGQSDARRSMAIARFEREARTTAALRSPHTVALYDFGVSDRGAFYYVMELLDGLDAAELVKRFGPMDPGRVVYLLRQICDSLGEAHAAGLIHRDIKPSNIFVCRYGRRTDFVKVLDFGLVKPTSPDSAQITADLTVPGTPGFMAPEQALADAPVDARSDVYAVGCVGYWLLTGQHVFEGSPMKMLAGHAHLPPGRPSERLDRPLPEALERLVMTCLEKDPALRPASADALCAALASLQLDDPWTDDDADRWWATHLPMSSRDVRDDTGAAQQP